MSDTGQLPPEAQLFQTLFGFMVTRTLSAVAELNVADALRDGPRSYTDLAQAVGALARARGPRAAGPGGRTPASTACEVRIPSTRSFAQAFRYPSP